MKKLGILFMAVLIAAIAGCAGDSSDPGGTLPIVQQLQIDATSGGTTVVLTWSAVDNAEGYEIYFRADGTGSWTVAGDVTTTTFTHNATNAGEYTVRAYDGDNFSEDYATAVSTMPMVFTSTYTIYDNYSAETAHSGFIFFDGVSYGVTGLAGDTNFEQDMYAYDESKGDDDVWLYAGNFGTYGNGYDCDFQLPNGSAYGYCDPNGFGTYSNSIQLLTSDNVIFVRLPYTGGTNAYAKIYNLNITPDTTPNGTIVSFSFEYQPNDYEFTLFTSSY